MFHCPEDGCLKSYTRKEALQAHLYGKHMNLKSHQCQHCNQCFVRVGDRTKHEKRIHLGIKDFVCLANGCFDAYATKFELNRHFKRFPLHAPVQDQIIPPLSPAEVSPDTGDDFPFEETWSMYGHHDVLPCEEDRATATTVTLLQEVYNGQYHKGLDKLLVGAGAWEDADIANWQCLDYNMRVDETRSLVLGPFDLILEDFSASTAVNISDLLRLDEDADMITFAQRTALLDTQEPWIAPQAVADDLTAPEFRLRLPSPVAMNDEDLKARLMQTLKVSISLYDIFQEQGNLKDLYSRIFNGVRRIRDFGVEDFENGIYFRIQKEINDSREMRDTRERIILVSLEEEYTRFSRLGVLTEKDSDNLAKEMPYAHIWFGLQVKENATGKEAKVEFQKDMGLLVKQIYQEKYGAPTSCPTTAWLDDVLSYALAFRRYCKSIASGHTSSAQETVRVPSHNGDENHMGKGKFWDVGERDLAGVTAALRLFGHNDVDFVVERDRLALGCSGAEVVGWRDGLRLPALVV